MLSVSFFHVHTQKQHEIGRTETDQNGFAEDGWSARNTAHLRFILLIQIYRVAVHACYAMALIIIRWIIEKAVQTKHISTVLCTGNSCNSLFISSVFVFVFSCFAVLIDSLIVIFVSFSMNGTRWDQSHLWLMNGSNINVVLSYWIRVTQNESVIILLVYELNLLKWNAKLYVFICILGIVAGALREHQTQKFRIQNSFTRT